MNVRTDPKFARKSNYGYTPSSAELVQYSNLNNLSSAHDVSLNREIISPVLSELQSTGYSQGQMQDFMGRDAQFATRKQNLIEADAVRNLYARSNGTLEERQADPNYQMASALRDRVTGEILSFKELSQRSVDQTRVDNMDWHDRLLRSEPLASSPISPEDFLPPLKALKGMAVLGAMKSLGSRELGVVLREGVGVNSTFNVASKSGLEFESTIARRTDRLTTYDLSTNQRIMQDGSIANRSYETSYIYTTFDESAGHLFIDKMGAQSGRYIGREMISNVIESIGPQNIRSIGAEFADTNLSVFKGIMGEGMTAEYAAMNTPLGKALRDLGYGPHFNSVVPSAYPRPTVNYVIKSK